MRKSISVNFNKGIQFPPALGTLALKPTADGKASYAQNVDVMSDEYGYSTVVPGPALTTIGNNAELTGVPIIRQFFGYSPTPLGHLYFAQGALGTKTVIRRIKDIVSGSTPTIDSTGSITIDHSSHTNLEVVDMVIRPATSIDFQIYVTGKDDTDTFLYYFNPLSASPTLTLVATNTNFTSGYTKQFLVFSSFDNNIYWIGRNRVSSVDISNNYTVSKLSLDLPLGTYASAGVDWQQQLLVAYSTEPFGGFDRRQSGGQAGIAIWDYVSPAIIKNIPAPCRYISCLINAPNGNLLAFGGTDEGKTSIYSFTGYGFQLITQYIGDMPRSRHSVDFDAQGRILWMTADGQLCRYDMNSGIFEHLSSVTTGSSAGGILAKGIGSPTGNEFFIASGTGSTYTMKKVQFGSYIGDGGGSDGITTPLAVSGTQVLPQGSTIEDITLALAKPLATGEKIELRIYKNGSTTDYQVYFTMEYAVDGAISMKREALTVSDINSFNLAVAWKQADGLTTAPPVLSSQVTIETIYG